jgi:hypothetical protein
MLALDLDPGHGDVDDQAAELSQLLKRLGARYVADVSPSGGRHVFVVVVAAAGDTRLGVPVGVPHLPLAGCGPGRGAG